MSVTLILGGARSGKSALAQRLATLSGRDVVFVATMQPGDDEVRARIAAHRAERPAAWATIEEPLDLVGALAAHGRSGAFVIVDCLTLWVSNLLIQQLGSAHAASPADLAGAGDIVAERAQALLDACERLDGGVALVSNEVGLGLVPPYPLGRAFRDALGASNMLAAARADRVLHCTAGLVLDLKAHGAVPIGSFGGHPGSW